jgi:hypothetical protein
MAWPVGLRSDPLFSRAVDYGAPCPIIFRPFLAPNCLQDSAMGVGSTRESVLPGYVSVQVASREVLVAPSSCSDTGSHHSSLTS